MIDILDNTEQPTPPDPHRYCITPDAMDPIRAMVTSVALKEIPSAELESLLSRYVFLANIYQCGVLEGMRRMARD